MFHALIAKPLCYVIGYYSAPDLDWHDQNQCEKKERGGFD